MKNLSAIPRLSSFAVYTILITLVVYLAGFTGAEAHLKFYEEGQDLKGREDGFYRRQSQEDASNAGMYSQKSSKVRDDELSQQRNFASYLNDIQRDVPLGMIMKRHSDFDESNEFDSERENDGYGYDDDEYYHFNYKRNDDASQKKGDKEGIGEADSKDKLSSDTFDANKVQNENTQKGGETIEMLNYKEMHPNPDPNTLNMKNVKPYTYQGQGQKNSLTPEPMETLKISDLKGNSALDEKIKGGKEEVGGVLLSPSEPKVAEVKKGAKVTEEKESLSLKDSKLVGESEKKDKELGLQDKSSLSSKNLKESAKSTEEKEKIEHDVKNVKLGESASLIEGIDKISKSKEGETAKITKEDKDNSRYYDRLNSEIIRSNGFSQLNNRVNLVGSDYKDNLEQLKRSGMEKDEKNSEESCENDINVNLNDYSDELRERKDILKESEYANNYGVGNNRDDSYSDMVRDLGKSNELLGIPIAYEVRNSPGEFFQKRESWKQDSNQPILFMSGSAKDGYRMNMPKNELENTEYHKNFMKSLKRYKTSEEQKTLNTIRPLSDKTPPLDKLPNEPYQERSKTKRGFLSYGDFDVENVKRGKYENDHLKIRRNAHANGDPFARELRLNSGEDRRKSQLDQQHESQPYDTRQRRKSQKFEYDIKTIDQGSSIGKSFSKFNSVKRKKEIKKKMGDQPEGSVVRQYPYSQVSRDYLSKFSRYNSDKKFKRKAPLWKRREQLGDESRDSDSTERNKGAPVGYYSNRVKFGQKVASQNDEEQKSDANKLNGISQFSTPYEKNRASVEKSWADTKNQNLRHDPSKRYDDKDRSNNQLLLLKKDKNGDRLAKAFTDANGKSEGGEELSSDQLAQILSKDSDYVVLKKKDKNKFQKLSDNQGSLDQTSSVAGFDSHKNTLRADSAKSDKSKLAVKHESGPRSDRGLYIRSYHSDEENKKYNSNKLHSSGTKSNLRKTFEKFRDLANLFRDNEQDSSDNQRQSSEAKVGGDIVFSEDRMPDPIVISNDANNKLGGFKSKSGNSISNISNNFKTLDQNRKSEAVKEDESDRTPLGSEGKMDNMESSWEPALKNVFPEAKSINSVQKDGNEIIVLDFNQNQLKPEASKMLGLNKPSQPIGPPVLSNSVENLIMGGYSGSPNSYGNIDSTGFMLPGGPPNMYQQKNPLIAQGDRQVEVILHEGVLPTFLQPDNANKPGEMSKESGGNQPVTKFSLNGKDGAYAIFSGTPNEAQITIPIYPLTASGKNSMEKNPNPMFPNLKSMTKKNSDYIQQTDFANNVKQLMKDFKELSKLYQTHDNRGALTQYSKEVVLPPGGFMEPSTNSNNKQKFLQGLLQSIMTNDKTGEGTPDTGTYQNDNVEFNQDAGDLAYEKPNLWNNNNVAYEADPTLKRQGKWTSAIGRKLDYSRYQSNKVELVPEEVRQDISKLLQSDGFKTTDKDKYQDSLWEELSEASDKIQRLRREGADKGKLKKTIEDALSCRERRQSETEKKLASDSKTGENNKNLESNVVKDESKSKLADVKSAASYKDDGNTGGKSNIQVEPQMKEGENKESHQSKRSVTKSDFESHLTDISPKDQSVNSNNSATKRRKRRHVGRRKRSLNSKNNVSTADIQNEILKNLAEDNDQSVYSSGIRRKLLWIQDDEDADNNINSKGNDEQLVTGETRLHSLNDPINNGINPTILTLSDANNGEKDEKSRERRSLSGAFHSNYKREIDLDESMPNDFQNFLVTSLSGFGSQKREVVKKEEALWEGKESSQDNFNQIVDSSQGGKDSGEDSALEKRDVSKSENLRQENFREDSNYFSDESGKEISRLKSGDSHSRKKARSQDKLKTSEFEEDKSPTHIRIQVTNASMKEKKSSKPIMDESENTSTEMENLPKEKEFLDKNKVRVNKAQKMYSLRDPKLANSNSVRLEEENPNNGRHQKAHYDTHPNYRRKKKKHVEENPSYPAKSFMAFDQRAMESLLRKYFTDQGSYKGTTQRIPVGSHLPQVETVYNPAQGANKAQLDKYRMSSLKGNSKTSANTKNTLKTNTPDSFDGETWRSYLQDKPEDAKSEKENLKSYIDADWKSLMGKSRDRFNSDQDIQTDIRIPKFGSDFGSPSTPTLGGYPSQSFDSSNPMMWSQPGLKYTNQKPSSNALYDILKLKQEMQPHNNINTDSSILKGWPKMSPGDMYNKADDKKPNVLYGQSPGEASWNHEYFFNKNPVSDKYKTKDSHENNIKGANKQKILDNILKLKSTSKSKLLRSAPQQPDAFDYGKDFDYLDVLDDNYINSDDLGKQDSQMDVAASGDLFKKFNKMFAYNPRHSKNTELDGTRGDEELDEDYDENNEEEDDYSLIAGSNDMNPDSGNHGGSERLPDSFRMDDSGSLYPKPVPHELEGTTFEHFQYQNPESEDSLDTNAGYIGSTYVRNDRNPFGDPSAVLRKVNENSNNFGENLMKNLNRYSYDETWKEMKENELNRIFENGFEPISNSKIDKRKINWRTKSKRNPLSEIGNRLFYASKSEAYDPKDLNHVSNQGVQSKAGRSVYYRLPKRNPMNAELRGAENEFEYESEGNGKHFTGNLLNGGKENSDDHDTTKLENSNMDSSNDEEDGGTNKRNSESPGNVDDVKENLEDDGETIAEDNILENVIGKYIMRKSVKAGALSRFNGRDEKKLSEDPTRHNLKKRSLEDILGEDHVPKVKVSRKRLSSGHLTENNFRKYHKKNPNKRTLKDLDENPEADVTSNDLINEEETSDVSEGNEKEISDKKQVTLSSDESEVKRSALDLFKKITSKNKDAKQLDDLNIRAAGFEPILSSPEPTAQSLAKEGNRNAYVVNLKKSTDSDPKALPETKDSCAEDNKLEKLDDITRKASSSAEGPWKIELKEKDNGKPSVIPAKNSEKKFKSTMLTKDRLTPSKTKQDLKTYTGFNKAAKRNSESEEATAIDSAKSQREVDNSFRAKVKGDAEPSERNIWKRSLKSSSSQVQGTAEDAMKSQAMNDFSTTATENYVFPVVTSKALHHTSSLSEENWKPRAHQDKKNSGFANVDEQVQNSVETRKFFTHNGSSNGKSIFPIPNDANIIGDNAHLNEETSKYLGQQIVDAILAQATTDPRFKKFIAPGLSVKPPHPRRRTEDDGKALLQEDFSDQVQTLMQTVMSDLEKIAEKHVKRSMCNQIDNQSKQFLHSLLDLPMEKITQARQINDKTRSIPTIFKREGSAPDLNSSNMVEVSIQEIPLDVPKSFNKLSKDLRKATQLHHSDQSDQSDQFEQFEVSNQGDSDKSAPSKKDAIFLMRKKYLLSHLLKSYQYLKDADMNAEYAEKVRALANELETTNKELAAIDIASCKCQKKKKPPKPTTSFPPLPPCPPLPPPPPPPPPCPPPPPPPCPPPPCPLPCPPPCPRLSPQSPANNDLGSKWLDVETKTPPANETQEEYREGTSETTTKEPADLYQFEPLGPLNSSDVGLPYKPKLPQYFGFENVTTLKYNPTQNICSETTPLKEPYNKPTTSPIDFGKYDISTSDNATPYKVPLHLSSLFIPPTLPKHSTEVSTTSKDNVTPNPLKDNFTPVSPKDNFTPISTKDNFTPTPFKDNFTPISLKDNFTPITFKDNFTPIPFKDDFTPIPFKDNFTPIPFKDNFTPIPFKDNFTPIPFKDDFTPIPFKDDFTPITFKDNFTPLGVDIKEPKDPSQVNLPLDLDKSTLSSLDWTKRNLTSILGLPDVDSMVPESEDALTTSTLIPDLSLLRKIKNVPNTLNIYNNGPVSSHNQFRHLEYPEGAYFRRNFYDKNVIPTDKDDDSASQKIRRDHKNRRSSRNPKNKWLSLRNFRQDQNMGEDIGEGKRDIRELRGWWRPKTHKQSQRTYLAQKRNEDNEEEEEEDPGMEYLVWSSMPAVRRRLNNMESVIDLDKISWPGLRRRNSPEEQRRQPGSV